MPVKQQTDYWLFQINRKGLPRVRKRFASKAEAESYEKSWLLEHTALATQTKDTRRLMDLIGLWYKYHGFKLADAEKRRRCLDYMALELHNPVASLLSAETFVAYRFKKMASGTSAKTFNNWHGYLSALYNTLIKLKVISYPNPLADVDSIKIAERSLSYLSPQQITRLFKAIESCTNPHTFYVAQLCLRTGCRWGEAEKLKRKHLQQGKICFELTKSKKVRAIPVDKAFFTQLLKHANNKDSEEPIFSSCLGSFRRAVDRAELTLPKGQCSHILRHTFASYFMMNGGNILSLQKILGHSDISMTLRYAHLAPDHLQDAIKLNPLAQTDKK